jgi:hypothetical protein
MRAKTLACPAIALFRATADAAPAKMSGISHLINKWKVLSFSSKKFLIYELETFTFYETINHQSTIKNHQSF